MNRRTVVSALLLALCLSAPVFAADPSGKWTASFDTQIGVQNYVYEFAVNGETVKGTASSDNGSTEIKDGKFSNDTLTFTEPLSFNGMEIRITYSGKLSGDEIQFTRNVGDFATEQLTAKRSK